MPVLLWWVSGAPTRVHGAQLAARISPVASRACFLLGRASDRFHPSQWPFDSIEKIVEIDTHIGVAISGLTADATTLIDHARVDAQYHRFTYDEPIKVESLTQSVCDLKMRFGEGGDDDKSKPKMVGRAVIRLTSGGFFLTSACL